MYMGIDIGGTKTRVARFSEDGKIEDVVDFPTDKDFGAFVPHLIEVTKQQLSDQTLLGIAVGAPGPIDRANGLVIRCGNLPWENADLRTPLSEAFSVPVILENDANVGAVGESALGAGKDFDSVLYITISTGIGTGVTYKNELPEVLLDSEGGQILMEYEGKLQVWEKFASGKAFTERLGSPGSEIEDPQAWDAYAKLLAPAFYNLARVIEPDVIVIGGGMGMNFAKFKAPLTDLFNSYYKPGHTPPEIVMAHDADNAVIYGCYVEAKRNASAS